MWGMIVAAGVAFVAGAWFGILVMACLTLARRADAEGIRPTRPIGRVTRQP